MLPAGLRPQPADYSTDGRSVTLAAAEDRVRASHLTYAALLLILAWSCPAWAHKIKVFATGEGTTIEGSVYFPGGGKARNVTVTVLDPSQKPLGETTTDENGEFTFETTVRCDHTFVVTTGDGHRAEYTVSAEELAGRLREPTPVSSSKTADGPPLPPSISSPDDLPKLVERAVSRQIRPLREQLDRYEEKVRLHDVLGGIGYIMGIMALVLYFKRKQNQSG